MSNYNIYLIDPFDKMPIVSVANILYQWFNLIAKKAGFSRAYICSPQYIVQPQQHELLIYICPLGTSVVQNMPGAQESTWPHPTTSSTQGVTVFNRITGSEVWAKFHDADAFASLIFHEAMHNKLQLDDRLHRKFNPASLSSSPITWPTSPAKPEMDAMSAALRNSTSQWPDGQQTLRDAAARFNHGDSMWNNQIVFKCQKLSISKVCCFLTQYLGGNMSQKRKVNITLFQSLWNNVCDEKGLYFLKISLSETTE